MPQLLFSVACCSTEAGRAQLTAAPSPSALPLNDDRTPTHGYETTRKVAMAAFAKSWRPEHSPARCGEAETIFCHVLLDRLRIADLTHPSKSAQFVCMSRYAQDGGLAAFGPRNQF